MQCPSPMSVKYPGLDNPKIRITVPCGKCGICLANKRNEWSFRIGEEWKYAKSAWFITFTYNDLMLPIVDMEGNTKRMWECELDEVNDWNPTLKGDDIKKLIKKVRYEQNKIKKERNLIKAIPSSLKNWRLRYYIVGEYAPETLRCHYHGLIFNMYPEVLEELVKYWEKGFICVGQVNSARIHYVTKYMITSKDPAIKKLLEDQKREPEFTYMSKRPGIGYEYLRLQGWNHKYSGSMKVRNVNGGWQHMPRFYRDKIFSISEKDEHLMELEEILNKKWEDDPRRMIRKQKATWDLGKMILEQAKKGGEL